MRVLTASQWVRVVIAICVLTLTVVSFYSINTLNKLDTELREETIDSWQERQRILIDSSAAGFQSVINHWEHTFYNFCKLPEIVDFDQDGKRLLQILFHDHPENISSVARVNKDGEILYVYPDFPEAIGTSIEDQVHFNLLKENNKPVLSGVFLTVQGYRAIAYHYPVLKNGEFDGSIGILIPFEKIAHTFLEPISLGEVSHLWLFDANGVVIYGCGDDTLVGRPSENIFGQPHPALIGHEKNDKTSGIVTHNISYEDPFSHSLEHGHNQHPNHSTMMHGVYERIPLANSYWQFVLATPENIILENATRYKNEWILVISLLLGVLFIILLMTVGLLLYLRHMKLKERLREDSTRVIKENEKKFRLLAENARDIIFRYNIPEGRFTYISPACEQITGYTPEEAIAFDQFFETIAHPSSKESIRKESERFAEGKIREQFSYRILDKQHSTKWLSMRGVLIKDAADRPLYLEGMISDVTAQKAWEAQLVSAKEKAEVANRAKTEFLSMISHELRTPLNPIVGFCDLLIEEADNDEQRETLNIMKESSEHLLNIIGDIIDIATVESGEMEIDYYPVELESFLEQTLAPHRVRAHEKKLKLKLHTEENLPETILVDGTRLRQVLNNLVSNAIKFTHKGRIDIILEINPIKDSRTSVHHSHTHTLRCAVRDTGIGVPPDRADHIFEPFVQADNSTTRSYGGTGLGLTICQRIAEKLGGSIRYHALKEGGSEFAIEIEVDILAPDAKFRSPSRVSREKIRYLRTLCVEDDPNSQLIMSKFLNRMSIRPDIAANGMEALQLLNYKEYDLILLDIHLPDIDGIEILHRLETDSNIEHKPDVIVITADLTEATKEKIRKTSSKLTLKKPIRYDDLLYALAAVTE